MSFPQRTVITGFEWLKKKSLSNIQINLPRRLPGRTINKCSHWGRFVNLTTPDGDSWENTISGHVDWGVPGHG